MRRRFVPLILTIMIAALAAGPAFGAGGKTLNNLQTAFNGESNASARYLVFAAKADEEGYLGVASLFRAASKAEGIHAATHAAEIKKFGAVPKAAIEKPVVKTTRENLEAAIAGETYERDVMYPEFINTARAEKESPAVKAFMFARTAEAEHAKLYTNALANRETMKKARNYYVCSVCGFTTTKVDFANCPGCAQPKDKYFAVS